MFETTAGSLMSLGYALAAGLMIGLQRGWIARSEADGSRVAGFRTFGLLGLGGGLAGLLPAWAGTILVAGAALLLAAGYWRQTASGQKLSVTNAIAALLTLGLGLLATSGRPTESIATAAIMMLLLSMRDTLHRLLRGVTEAEMRATARFGLIALVILPLAPDQAMGPLDAWNPHKLWLVVVLVSGLSFAGYIATRRAAPGHSVPITALCGALVSSTAVTAASARRLAAGGDHATAYGTAIVLAGAVMYARVLVLTLLLAPTAALSLSAIIAPALLLLAVPTVLGLRGGTGAREQQGFTVGNPLELGVAFGLAALVAAMMLASRWALERFGHLGLAAILVLTGFADVDAAVMTLAAAEPGMIAPNIAGIVLAGPVMANTILKAGITLGLAPNRHGARPAGWLLASAATSAAIMMFLL